jgi:hypothetical protein
MKSDVRRRSRNHAAKQISTFTHPGLALFIGWTTTVSNHLRSPNSVFTATATRPRVLPSARGPRRSPGRAAAGPTRVDDTRVGARASERRSARGRADAVGGRASGTAGVSAHDRPRFVCECASARSGARACRRARPRGRPALRRLLGCCWTRDSVERAVLAAQSRSRPSRNGPQPRSWGKPGRDAKSVVPGLRPGDRRARRRWPAAAGFSGVGSSWIAKR